MPSEMTQERADPALGRNTEADNSAWAPPGLAVPCLTSRGLWAGSKETLQTHQRWQPWPQDTTFPPVLQQQRSQNHAGSAVQRAGTTGTVLRNYCTLQPCMCALRCKQSTSGTGIHNPTLLLHPWLLTVFLSLNGNPFMKARAASPSRQGHQVLQLQEL